MKSVRLSVLVITLCSAAPVFALDLSLFGDIALISAEEESGISFQLGEVDLMADQEVGDNSRAIMEIVFEDDGHGFEPDVERFSVNYSLGDPLTVSAGRFHTPIGFWNFNFHHGLLLQDTVTRPFFLEFEDAHEGVFATHMVGVMADGEVSWRDHRFDYTFAIVNSPSIDTGSADHTGGHTIAVGNHVDASDAKSALLRLGLLGDEDVWGIGLSAMYNYIVESGEQDPDPMLNTQILPYGEVLFEQTITGLDFQYRPDRYYLYAEYFKIDMVDSQKINSSTLVANDKPYSGTAWYVQVGYRAGDNYNLALRREVLEYDDNATYFEMLNVEPQERTVLALRYDLEESSGLRFQYSDITHTLTGDKEGKWAIQWYFLVF